MTVGDLQWACERSWSAFTSSDQRRWRPSNPAFGQGAVTACVVQDYLGGDIVFTTAHLPDGTKEGHYYNLADGKETDLTSGQFPAGTTFTPEVPHPEERVSAREHIMSRLGQQIGYELLSEEVSLWLDELQHDRARRPR